MHEPRLTMLTRKNLNILWVIIYALCFCGSTVLASLLEGTLVATAHGLVPIQNLKVGDKVLGYDLEEPNHEKATREVAVTKIEKHLTDSLFTLCTEAGWVEASPHQLIFTLLPETSENKVRVMDFAQAQYITEDCQLIDTQMKCLPIFETNRMELSCTYPEQYAEKKKHGKHKRVKEVSRCKVSVNMYALEVEAPHVFLISENPYVKDITKTKLLLTHNGIPALAAGVSFVFDAAPSTLAFGEATASIGGLGVVFGPVGVTLGVVTSLGFLGYQLLKGDNKSHQQSQFYIERAGPSSTGDMGPKEPKDKDENNEISRKAAFNEAKRRAGITKSQQPSRQWQVGDDAGRAGQSNYRYSRDPATHGRYYEYDTPQGKRVVVEHTNDGDPHMHAGKPKPGGDPRNYDFKENRYQKIIGSDGDHHIYYNE